MTNRITSLLAAIFSLVENHANPLDDNPAYKVYDNEGNVIGQKSCFTNYDDIVLVGIRVIIPEKNGDDTVASADISVADIENGVIETLRVTAHASIDGEYVIDDVCGDINCNNYSSIIRSLMSIIKWMYKNEWYEDSFVPHFYPHGSRCSAEDVSDDDAESIASAIADAANEVE